MKYLAQAAVAAGVILAGVGVHAEEFQWSWEKSAEGAPTGAVKQAAVQSDAPAGGARKADAAAFDTLVQENLDLRRKIESVSRDEEATRQENARLAAWVKELEKNIAASAVHIEDLKKQKSKSGGDAGRVSELEAQLAAAEGEKSRLGQELAEVRKQMEGAAAPAQAPAGGQDIRQGSDLYRDMERQNAQLKQKLAELEAEQQKDLKDQERVASDTAERDYAAQRQVEQRQNLEKELAAARASEDEYKDLIRKLLDQIPGMEQQVSDLQGRLREKDSTLDSRERDLESMQAEIERREQRLQKAERMVALLDAARGEVRKASDVLRRDMHYNMAAVYARDGRFAEAEREYLRALRVDPSDADVHYNLGVLYDDKLRDTARAIMHYRRYLLLRPGAQDSDQVRNWLLELQVKVEPRNDER